MRRPSDPPKPARSERVALRQARRGARPCTRRRRRSCRRPRPYGAGTSSGGRSARYSVAPRSPRVTTVGPGRPSGVPSGRGSGSNSRRSTSLTFTRSASSPARRTRPRYVGQSSMTSRRTFGSNDRKTRPVEAFHQGHQASRDRLQAERDGPDVQHVDPFPGLVGEGGRIEASIGRAGPAEVVDRVVAGPADDGERRRLRVPVARRRRRRLRRPGAPRAIARTRRSRGVPRTTRRDRVGRVRRPR